MMLARRKLSLARRELCVLAAGAALLAGCSNSSQQAPAPTGPLPAAQQLQSESATFTKAQTSAHVVVTTSGAVPDFLVQKLEGDLASKPQTVATGHIAAKMGGQLVEGDFRVLEDGHLWASIFGPWQDFGDAAKALNGYQVSDILSSDKGLGNIVASIQNPVAEGREQIGGINTVKIKGKVSADVLKPLYPGAKQDADTTVWAQEDGSHQLARVVVEVSPGNTINIDPSKWGEPVTVTKPA